MKKVFLNVALIAAAIGITGKVNAQVVRTITGSEKVSCTGKATGTSQTLLDGAWAINTDASGKLVITDKSNNVIRMIADGGITKLAEKGSETEDIMNYPVSLVVDKCGNLHLTDNTSLSGNKSGVPVPLIRETNSWGDPDAQGQATSEDAVVTVKNPTRN